MRPRSVRSFEDRISPEAISGCFLWTGTLSKKGYGQFTYERKSRLAHRLSYQLYVGPIPDGLCVLHHCDNPSCVNPEHLWLGTNYDNVMDRVAKNRSSRPRGSLSGKAKYNQEIIEYIRSSPKSLRALQRELGITFGYISQIRNYKCW